MNNFKNNAKLGKRQQRRQQRRRLLTVPTAVWPTTSDGVRLRAWHWMTSPNTCWHLRASNRGAQANTRTMMAVQLARSDHRHAHTLWHPSIHTHAHRHTGTHVLVRFDVFIAAAHYCSIVVAQLCALRSATERAPAKRVQLTNWRQNPNWAMRSRETVIHLMQSLRSTIDSRPVSAQQWASR